MVAGQAVTYAAQKVHFDTDGHRENSHTTHGGKHWQLS